MVPLHTANWQSLIQNQKQKYTQHDHKVVGSLEFNGTYNTIQVISHL